MIAIAVLLGVIVPISVGIALMVEEWLDPPAIADPRAGALLAAAGVFLAVVLART